MAIDAGSRGLLEKIAVCGRHMMRGVMDQVCLDAARDISNLCSTCSDTLCWMPIMAGTISADFLAKDGDDRIGSVFFNSI